MADTIINLYAWSKNGSNESLYTRKSSPSVNDYVYSDFYLSGGVPILSYCCYSTPIVAVGNNTISTLYAAYTRDTTKDTQVTCTSTTTLLAYTVKDVDYPANTLYVKNGDTSKVYDATGTEIIDFSKYYDLDNDTHITGINSITKDKVIMNTDSGGTKDFVRMDTCDIILGITSKVYIYEKNISDTTGRAYSYSHISVNGDQMWSPGSELVIYNNKKCFVFTANNASGTITVTTTDAFKTATAIIGTLDENTTGAYVILKPKNLYGWDGPHSALWINDPGLAYYEDEYLYDFYTDTQTPVSTSSLYTNTGLKIDYITGLNPGGGSDCWQVSDGLVIGNNTISVTPT